MFKCFCHLLVVVKVGSTLLAVVKVGSTLLAVVKVGSTLLAVVKVGSTLECSKQIEDGVFALLKKVMF